MSKLDLSKLGYFKIEGSAFNGHEPNEERWSIQLAPLDSWSFRATAAPTRNWTAQYSYGCLLHPEALDPNNELRQSASLEYNRPLSGGKLGNGNWATSLIWGRKHKELERHNSEQLPDGIDAELSGAELRLYPPGVGG